MIAIIFRTDDGARWGAGKGANLSAAEIDANFWEIATAIQDIVDHPPVPAHISNIEVARTAITFVLSDGSSLGPVQLPVVMFRWRGDWQTGLLYETLDTFRVSGQGIFSVLRDHTADPSFDPARTIDGDPVYQQLFGQVGAGLADLSDVALASPADGDFLGYDGGAGKWINRAPADATALLDEMVGDSGSGGAKGLVPAPAAGDAAAFKYLSADGSFSAPLPSGSDADALVYDSGAWSAQRQKYEVRVSFTGGVLANSQLLGLHRFSKAATFPANFASYLGHSSQAGGTANATGSTVIAVDKATNASPNSFSGAGTITIGAGGVSPTLATTGGAPLSFTAGDVMRFMGPSTADATFANFYTILIGYET